VSKPTVIIPVKNHVDMTAALVTALIEQGGYHRLLVYDNGSTDGTKLFLDNCTADRIDATGWGLHKMWNHGLDHTPRDSVAVILNNDLVLDEKPDWLHRLCAPLVGAWAAVCPNYDGREADGRVMHPLKGLAWGKEDGTGGLSGFAFALDAAFSNGYRFPEELLWWYGDHDMVNTLDSRGLPYGMVLDVGVRHIGGGSQTAKDYELGPAIARDASARPRHAWETRRRNSRSSTSRLIYQEAAAIRSHSMLQ